QFMHELKSLPAPSLKAQMLFRMCLNDNDKSDCDHVLNAIAGHDAAECAELAKAPMRTFCAAVAQADATKCDSLEVSDQRSMCAAFASDDPSHCPKEEGRDCVAMTRAFATWKLAEPVAAADMDPVGAALRWGKPAYCAPLLADFERVCAE